MKFKTTFYAIEFDFAQYKKLLANTIEYFNEEAGKLWLDATVRGVPIPTWGGASRATFQTLAAALGTSVPIGSIRGKNTVAEGRASTNSVVVNDRKRLQSYFIYQTSLAWLVYNEYNQAVKGPFPQPWSDNVKNTPYRFQAAGKVAWKHYASRVKLPSPIDSIKARKM